MRPLGFGLLGVGGVLALGSIVSGNVFGGGFFSIGGLIIGLPFAVPGALFVAASNAQTPTSRRVLKGLGCGLLGLTLAALIGFIIWLIVAFRDFN